VQIGHFDKEIDVAEPALLQVGTNQAPGSDHVDLPGRQADHMLGEGRLVNLG